MFIANIMCRFKKVPSNSVMESGTNINKRCWYAGYNLNSCRLMLEEANDKLAELKALERPDDDFRIACWEHTANVLQDEINYRIKNNID